jgi:hypothetical protein
LLGQTVALVCVCLTESSEITSIVAPAGFLKGATTQARPCQIRQVGAYNTIPYHIYYIVCISSSSLAYAGACAVAIFPADRNEHAWGIHLQKTSSVKSASVAPHVPNQTQHPYAPTSTANCVGIQQGGDALCQVRHPPPYTAAVRRPLGRLMLLKSSFQLHDPPPL